MFEPQTLETNQCP